MVLWLDDVRRPWEHGFVGANWVTMARQAIELLKTGEVTFASLDHDLAWEHYPGSGVEPEEYTEQTGEAVLRFLEEFPEYLPVDGISVHSLNPVGRPRMVGIVEKLYGRNFQDRLANVGI